jgi:nanoRNase/pAp phosphatase (c-di-AMP/oligoRNAs hydrolase)
MIGITSYYDMSEVSDLIQIRVRASRDVSGIDLRTLLTDLDIKDGGGHPGAIGFRIPKGEMKDLSGFIADLLNRIEAL